MSAGSRACLTWYATAIGSSATAAAAAAVVSTGLAAAVERLSAHSCSGERPQGAQLWARGSPGGGRQRGDGPGEVLGQRVDPLRARREGSAVVACARNSERPFELMGGFKDREAGENEGRAGREASDDEEEVDHDVVEDEEVESGMRGEWREHSEIHTQTLVLEHGEGDVENVFGNVDKPACRSGQHIRARMCTASRPPCRSPRGSTLRPGCAAPKR